MEKIIHNPEDIVVGKLYKTVRKEYRDSVLYLGVSHHTSQEKFLVIVLDDACGLVGRMVVLPNKEVNNLWNDGFIEQDTTN